MVVREEDLAEVEQPDVRPHQLPLCSLGAVDQEPVSAAPQQERRRRAATRRLEPRCRGTRGRDPPGKCRVEPWREFQAACSLRARSKRTGSTRCSRPRERRRSNGVRVIEVRHAQTAAHAAHAWGHGRRRCGVALVASVTGAIPAIARSFVAQTPLVVIGDASEELDALAMVRPITKWAGVCERPEHIPELVAHRVPSRARAAARSRLPRAVAGRAPRRDGRRRRRAVAYERAQLRRSARGDARGGGAERRGTARGGRRQRDLVGRRLEAARVLRRERPPADVTRGLRSRRAAAGPRAPVPVLASIGARRGRCRLRVGTTVEPSEFRDAKLVHIHADATEIGGAARPTRASSAIARPSSASSRTA